MGLLDALSACDQVIGSPFADPQGKGMDKYIDHFMSVKGNREKPEWWQMLVNRWLFSEFDNCLSNLFAYILSFIEDT